MHGFGEKVSSETRMEDSTCLLNRGATLRNRDDIKDIRLSIDALRLLHNIVHAWHLT